MDAPEPRRNLERKARCADLDGARAALARLGARCEGVQWQTDVYFPVASGRLKLRFIEGQPALLIGYQRPDQGPARLSAYYLVPVSDPVLLRTALAAALGVRGEVRKRREVHHWHNVRIHLDEVEGLGRFVEFEAVLAPGADPAESREFLRQLGEVLALEATADTVGSYADQLGL
jgi:adenylate cyclase class IV